MARTSLLTTTFVFAAASAVAATAVAAASAAPIRPARVAVHAAAPAVVAPPAPVRAKPAVTRGPAPVRKPAVRHVAPKPAPTATHRAVAPEPAPKPAAAPTHRSVSTASTLTPQQRMMHAVGLIPGYRTGDAVWVMRKQSNWGLALMGGGTVYISTAVPADKMYDVVSHEWSHLLSVRDYGNDVKTATAAMNAYFGGSGLVGSERAADCMAKLLGAVWTHYTPCADSHWVAGAKKLVAGQRL